MLVRAALLALLAAPSAAPAQPPRWETTAEHDRHGCVSTIAPFESGSAELNDTGRRFLEGQLDWQRKLVEGGAWLEVDANADHLEVRADPSIGQRRAEAVRRYLASHAIDPRHILTRDWKDSRPLADPAGEPLLEDKLRDNRLVVVSFAMPKKVFAAFFPRERRCAEQLRRNASILHPHQCLLHRPRHLP